MFGGGCKCEFLIVINIAVELWVYLINIRDFRDLREVLKERKSIKGNVKKNCIS